jgi:hypothetical protein
MKDQAVPNSDHIARHCKASTAPNGEIQPTAFMLREGEEFLSVNWLEDLKCPDRNSEVRALRDLYARKMRVGVGARIAILNVGRILARVQSESVDKRVLRVLHEPEPDDPSHAGIFGISYDDREIMAELIVQEVLESHTAR